MKVGTVIDAALVSHGSAIDLAVVGIDAAARIGFAASVAIADATGELRAFQRADGALPFTAEIAIAKARTAALSGLATADWNAMLIDPVVAPMANTPGVTAVAGGRPLFHGGQLVGAVGVSGASPESDDRAARHVVDLWSEAVA